MKRMVLILILLLVPMAHAENPQEEEGTATQHLQNIEKQLSQQGVQKDEARALARAMNQAHFSEEQMIRVANQFKSIDKQGITTRAIHEKINEGISKGIAPETILQATLRVRNRFEFAMNLAAQLDKKNQARLGKTIADCLIAGLTEEDARSVAASLQTRTQNHDVEDSSQNLRMETLHTARDLARQGVSSATATGVIGAALAQSYDAEAMRTLRTRLRTTEIENIERMTKQFTSAIAHGVKAGDLQASGNAAYGKGASSTERDNGHGNSGSSNSSGGDTSGGSDGGGDSGNGGGGGSGDRS